MRESYTPTESLYSVTVATLLSASLSQNGL